MLFIDETSIHSALYNPETVQWNYTWRPIFETDALSLSGISAYAIDDFTSFLFYGRQDETGWSIQQALRTGSDVTDIDVSLSIPGVQISDPFVVYDSKARQWYMYFSQYDGVQWTIGLATSRDLEEWTIEPGVGFSLEGVDVAVPVISEEPDKIRMWYARRDTTTWNIGYAESTDGINWLDNGEVISLEEASETPPSVALHASPTTAFRIEGEVAGPQLGLIEVTGTYTIDDYGWFLSVLAGQWVDTEAFGTASAGGVQLDSVVDGLAWFSIQDEDKNNRIGIGEVRLDEEITPTAIGLEASETGFDQEGVHSPIVWKQDNTYHMIYAGESSGITTLGHAESDDGYTWNKTGQILTSNADWNAIALVPDHIEKINDEYRLWVSGFNGSTWKIGVADSSDGLSWSLDSDPIFSAGSPGDWDDSSVKDATIRRVDDQVQMWYAGNDGDIWRIGYATLNEAGTWSRTEEQNGIAQSVIDEQGLFYSDGTQRPRYISSNNGYELYYAGIQQQKSRVGKAVGLYPANLRPTYRHLNYGDQLQFDTFKGDDTIDAIPLDTSTADIDITGVGLSSLHVDSQKGVLYATSKLTPYIIVIDIRDDTDLQAGFLDKNYLGIEAVLGFTNSSGAIGFRQILAVDENKIYALNDSPEAVFIIDVSGVEDNAHAELIRDPYTGWLPANLGAEDDQGADTRMSIGPGQMAKHPTEEMLFVTNFNTNSVSVYDLRLGPHGELVKEIDAVGENPYGIAIRPDGKYAVVAVYTGEVDETSLAESKLVILDTDPESPTYLEVISEVVNR